MQANAREIWLLNFYRNSELHGALLMGRLARSYRDAELVTNLSHHCSTEARHAAMLAEALAELDAPVDPDVGTIQAHYGDAGGIPTALTDLLVLSEVLEKRVLASYRTHLARTDVSATTRRTLESIVHEMEMEEDGTDPHAGWIDRTLDDMPPDEVRRAKARWREVDAQVAAGLQRQIDERFAMESRS
jgi:bacterioferritin (cytochrome b1)